MTREIDPSAEIARLLAGVSGSAERHLSEVESDLRQTGCLLAEAIGKLTASFMAIHDAVDAQQRTIERLAADSPACARDAAQLKQRAEEIGGHINAAITGLQFQDMTDQLIGRTVRRVAGLKDVFAALDAAGLARAAETGGVADALDRMGGQLTQRSETLERTLWKTVCQTHMESGDVELF